jgi:hypothetical protein
LKGFREGPRGSRAILRVAEKKKPAYAGLVSSSCSGERGTNSALTELQDYFFLEAFFLPFFFALAMLALQY